MVAARAGLGFVLMSVAAVAQQYTISTFAGGGIPPNALGTSTGLGEVCAVAVDSSGNLFVASRNLNVVLRLDTVTGVLTLVAGSWVRGSSGDSGPATSAQLSNPSGLAVDSAGNVYISDLGNNRVRKVSNGVITTVAGTGTPGFGGDNGPAPNAQLNYPSALAVDSAGNLYIADRINGRVRKVFNGIITTVAGTGTAGFSGDNGPATSAQLYNPSGVVLDSVGNLYIADIGNNRVRKVTNGVITTVAGTGTPGFSGDNGPATSAQLNSPSGIAVDSLGNLYIADIYNNRIRKVSNGVIVTAAGNGAFGFSGDNGPATTAQLNFFANTTSGSEGTTPVSSVAVGLTGKFYVSDTGNHRIRQVSSGIITTLAGTGAISFTGDDVPAATTQLGGPAGVAVDSVGNLYIADQFNNRVRKVTNGIITTVAGDGIYGFGGDNGPATSCQLAGPQGVAVDTAGNLYIADSGNNRIRKVTNGIIVTVAGNGTIGFSGDNGPAIGAQLNGIWGIAVDTAGNLYIADSINNRIRKVSNGVITTIAGTGVQGFGGDNGPATSAQLNTPKGVAVDSAGNLFVADYDNNRIRKVASGVISTVAGGGSLSGNILATSAVLSAMNGVAVDSAGSFYSTGTDPFSSRVFKVSSGYIATIAGEVSRGIGFSGDNGPATSATLNLPYGIAVDASGRVYVADSRNNRIRLLTPVVPQPAVSITAVQNAASFTSGQIAPGEIIVLYGSGIGPDQLVKAPVSGDSTYPKQLADTTVAFNGIAAPIVYTWSTQISAIVPYGITGTTAQVTVTYQGQTTAASSVPVALSAPGIFTADSTGKGQAAVYNQDGITLNSASNPAKTGDIISLFATGEGQTTPTGVDGKPASGSLPQPNLPVSVIIGGQRSQAIPYVGGAPGQVAGLMQVNVQIPNGIQTGNAVPVVVQVGNASSQPGVTIAVR